MYTSTKLFREFPNAYRNPNSKSDCYLLHGYCRDFYFVFGADNLDKQGFVFDYGALDIIKHWLEEKFDHTVLLQADDPYLYKFKELEKLGLMKVTVLPLVSCEGIAEYVGVFVNEWLETETDNRVRVVSCECRENGKNSAVWTNTPGDYRLRFYDSEEMVDSMIQGNIPNAR